MLRCTDPFFVGFGKVAPTRVILTTLTDPTKSGFFVGKIDPFANEQKYDLIYESDKMKSSVPQNNPMYENVFEKEALILHAETVIRIADIDADAFFLYMFYCMTAKRQSLATGKYINQISASRDYCRDGMKWGTVRYQKARKILLQYKFIEDIIKRDKGTVESRYVRIHFLQNAYKGTKPSYKPSVSKPTDGNDELASEPSVSKTIGGSQDTNTERQDIIYTDSLGDANHGVLDKKAIEHKKYSEDISHSNEVTEKERRSLVVYLASKQGMPNLGAWGKQKKLINQLIEDGWSPDQIRNAIDRMMEDSYWKDFAIDFVQVSNNIHKYATKEGISEEELELEKLLNPYQNEELVALAKKLEGENLL